MKNSYFFRSRKEAFVLARHYKSNHQARQAARELSRALNMHVRVVLEREFKAFLPLKARLASS